MARIKEGYCGETLIADPEQKRPDRSHEIGKPPKPDTGDQGSPQPNEDISKEVSGHMMDEDVER